MPGTAQVPYTVALTGLLISQVDVLGPVTLRLVGWAQQTLNVTGQDAVTAFYSARSYRFTASCRGNATNLSTTDISGHVIRCGGCPRWCRLLGLHLPDTSGTPHPNSWQPKMSPLFDVPWGAILPQWKTTGLAPPTNRAVHKDLGRYPCRRAKAY